MANTIAMETNPASRKGPETEPGDIPTYSESIRKLEQRIKNEKFSYADAISKRLRSARDRALALLLIGVMVLCASLLLSDFLPGLDEPIFIFLRDNFSIALLDPFLGSLISFTIMLVPAALVFAFLVYLHNRETRFWFYLTRKAKRTTKKGRFFVSLIEPFFMLVAGIIISVLLLFIFSLLDCAFFFCTFYEKTFYFSSNLLFNLFALSFYFIILGGVQIKRYVSLIKSGITELAKEGEFEYMPPPVEMKNKPF